jgi:hypothetical protein
MGQRWARPAELGPAFSAVEQDIDGRVTAVLACAGLAETNPTLRDRLGGFAGGLRPAQWSALTAAIRAVVEGADYARIDMVVRSDWPAARRYRRGARLCAMQHDLRASWRRIGGIEMSQSVPGLSIGLQAGSAMFDAVAQSNAYNGAAAVDRDNANQDLLQGAFNMADIRRRGRAVQGEAISALAEGGGAEGQSAHDLIFQNALEIEYAAMSAKYGAANAARADLFKAAQDKSAARNAIFGGILRAGAAAVTGVQDAKNRAAGDAAYRDRYDAYFPGGQRLPMPPPIYTPSRAVGPR